MQDVDLVTDFLVQFFYYLLLLYGFVPISLYVSQNFIRYFQVSGLCVRMRALFTSTTSRGDVARVFL